MWVNDYILNGSGHGPVGEAMERVMFQPTIKRPFYDERGRPAVLVNTGRKTYDDKTGQFKPVYEQRFVSELLSKGIVDDVLMTANATSLSRDAWKIIDRTVQGVFRQRLQAWTDLSAASSISGFDGMGKMTFEYESMPDFGEAVVDMEGLAQARHDEPLFKVRSVPLPITHAGFHFSERRLMVSKNGNQPLDLAAFENGARRIAETVERTLIGLETGIEYGTDTSYHDGFSKVYGYTNFPYRITKTDLTVPTGSNPEAINTDILEMIETMQTNGYFGPYIIYMSTPYSRYLADDYFRSGSTSAVRSVTERIMQNPDIRGIRRLDYLTSGFQMIMVQMDSRVATALNGMDIVTMQWKSHGQMMNNFRIMTIQVPLLRAPYNGVAGILHATTS